MIKNIIFIVSFLLLGSIGFAQKDINNYKYVLVPKKYEFLKGENKYQLNSLTKFLFNKYGFEAYFTDEDLPDDLKNDRCLALMSDVSKEKGGIFKTKIKITLKDCYGVAVLASQVGDSRKKEYDKAYTEALREAFETFQNTDYKYLAQEAVKEIPKEEKQPVKEIIKVEEKKEVALTETNKKSKEIKTELSKSTTSDLYYAQPINNGFQIVNSEPKIVMILLTTSAKDVFIVKNKNAIVYKKNDKWLYSENDGTIASDREVNIKF